MAKGDSPHDTGGPPPRARRKPQDKSFVFRDIVNVIKSTGLKAATLAELRSSIAEASQESLFHHMYQYYLTGHVLEHTNDFANWASESLEERALAEQLSNIDPYACRNIEEVRAELLRVIDGFIANFPETRPVVPGYEFYFAETVTYVFPAGLKARNMAEFLMAIKYVDQSSIYYHFHEARSRLRKSENDFSKWIREVQKAPEIADALQRIDPFMNNIDSIREQIAGVLENAIKVDMEVVE